MSVLYRISLYILITLSSGITLSSCSSKSTGPSDLKPESIVIPVAVLGEVSDIRRKILQNTLNETISTKFRIVPQERFEQAQEEAFQQLEYEECTEDQCIVMIQEMLQVENVFHLQVLGEGDDTQLSLSWRTLDEKRKETDICSGCGTIELSGIVMGLVGRLVGVEEEIIFKREPTKNVDPVVVETPIVLEESTQGILYGREENGEWKWFNTGNEETDEKYVGEFKNDMFHGKGKYYYSNGDKFEGELSGEVDEPTNQAYDAAKQDAGEAVPAEEAPLQEFDLEI